MHMLKSQAHLCEGQGLSVVGHLVTVKHVLEVD